MAAEITKRTYTRTGIALLVLLTMSIIASELPLGEAGFVISLCIAAVKVTLVAMFFMHLRISSGAARIFAGAGLFWLAILIGLTLSDFLSRALPVT